MSEMQTPGALVEILDDIIIPRTDEIVIPTVREHYEDEDEFFLIHKGKSPDDGDERVRRFMGTLQTQDRKGDEVMLSGWDFGQFKRNPIVLWNHRLTGELTDILGRVTRIKREKIQRKDGSDLEGWAFDVWFLPGKDVNPAFHDNGDLAKAMLDVGVLNACSVTFRPITSQWLERDDNDVHAQEPQKGERRHDEPGVRWLKKELLEFSLCMVGAHQDALQLARAKGLIVPAMMENDLERMPIVSRPGWDDKDEYTEIRYRIREPGQFQDGSFRRVAIKEEKPRVIAIMGRLKGQTTMTIQALRFPKGDGWTVEKAKAWLKSNKDAVKAWGPEEDMIEIPAPTRDESPVTTSWTPQEAANPDRNVWLDTVTREAQRSVARGTLPRQRLHAASLPEEAFAESTEWDTVATEPAPVAHRLPVTAEMGQVRSQQGHAKRRIVQVTKRIPSRKKLFRVLRRSQNAK